MRQPQRAGALKIVAAIEEPAVIVRILMHLGLPARAPPAGVVNSCDGLDVALSPRPAIQSRIVKSGV